MSKSSCCGAEFIRLQKVEDSHKEMGCDECKNFCDSIPDDIMSRKEIVAFCEERIAYLDRLRTLGEYKGESDYVFLTSVKHYMGEK